MDSSQPTDTFVIFYTERSGCWAAISPQSHLVGTGKNPNDALVNAITTAEKGYQAAAACSKTQVSRSSYELMRILAQTATSLPDGDYVPGVVYKCECVLPE